MRLKDLPIHHWAYLFIHSLDNSTNSTIIVNNLPLNLLTRV